MQENIATLHVQHSITGYTSSKDLHDAQDRLLKRCSTLLVRYYTYYHIYKITFVRLSVSNGGSAEAI